MWILYDEDNPENILFLFFEFVKKINLINKFVRMCYLKIVCDTFETLTSVKFNSFLMRDPPLIVSSPNKKRKSCFYIVIKVKLETATTLLTILID